MYLLSSARISLYFSIFLLTAFMPMIFVVTEEIFFWGPFTFTNISFSLIGWSSFHPVALFCWFQTDQGVPSYVHFLVATGGWHCSGLCVLCGKKLFDLKYFQYCWKLFIYPKKRFSLLSRSKFSVISLSFFFLIS